MSGSLKGRVLLPASARPSRQETPREGICAWCGGPVLGTTAGCCGRCGSQEIDWATPRVQDPERRHVVRDEAHTPGTIAYSVLGATVHRRR